MASEPMQRQRLRIGLTGGIGSGKSAVAQRLAERGAAVVDADLVSHQLTAAGGAAIAPIRQQFGADMIRPDGALDRGRMRALVFADPARRAQLQSILHPLIGQRMQEQAQTQPGPYLLLVVPLLVEQLPRWRAELDRIAVVDCPPQLQLQRVIARSGLAPEQVLAIMASQASREQRLAAADDMIDNSTDLPALMRASDQLHEKYLELAAGV